KLSRYLTEEKKEHVLSNQLLRSGTSIGANVSEGVRAQSKPDFVHKMSVALKEAGETAYWLRLLHETGYLTDAQFESVYSDANELIALLVSICKSASSNL
ncbi:MAG: four helix bundle protein, partial [Clostridia bacterium]|nr:four helix bundle protein [Clostridia bacterium]